MEDGFMNRFRRRWLALHILGLALGSLLLAAGSSRAQFAGGVGGNIGGGNGKFAEAAANLNLAESPRPLDRVYLNSRYYNTIGKTVEPAFGRTDFYHQTLG